MENKNHSLIFMLLLGLSLMWMMYTSSENEAYFQQQAQIKKMREDSLAELQIRLQKQKCQFIQRRCRILLRM